MSQTTAPQQPAILDPKIAEYLNSVTVPQQATNFAIDPQYHNMRFTTVVGRLAYCHVAAPHAIAQPGRPPGKPKFTATLLMGAGTQQNPILADIGRAIAMVADSKWPSVARADPNNPGQLSQVRGSEMFQVPAEMGGFHYPLRSGDAVYMKEPAKFGEWRGLWFINTSMEPMTKSGQPQRPVYLDEVGAECDPLKFYSGCYARLGVSVAAFDNAGNKGVTFYLNAIQFAGPGPRMSTGFDAAGAAKAAMGAAGALPVPPPMDSPAFGPNTAGAQPPGVAGFAAPPPGGYQQQPAPQPPVQAQPAQQPYIPPQQAQQPGGGARPPGV